LYISNIAAGASAIPKQGGNGRLKQAGQAVFPAAGLIAGFLTLFMLFAGGATVRPCGAGFRLAAPAKIPLTGLALWVAEWSGLAA
jgi:hypothetical protein